MSDVVEWTFYYPHPDYDDDVFVTTPNPYLGRIGSLWTLAKTLDPSLADHIGNERLKFYIVRSSFLYKHRWFFSYLL